VTAAQNAANAANTLAGGKGKVIVQTAAPAAADQLAQNLWIDITGGANTPKRWTGSAWVAVTDKVATDAAAAAANALSVANTKADASAVNSLTTRVEAAEGTISSQGSSITGLNNSLTTTNTNVTAAQNAANSANTLAGGKGKVLVQAAAPAAADQLAQNLWIDITGGANTPKRWTGSAWAAVTDKVATDAAAAAANALSVANTKADASAVNSLTNRVTAAEGTITSQASSITNLTASISNVGSDNLLYNPSFDVVDPALSGLPAGWMLNNNNVTVVPSVVASTLDSAGKAARLDITLNNASSYSSLRPVTGEQPVTVPGQVFTLSVSFRATVGMIARLYFQWMSATGNWISDDSFVSVSAAEEWQRISKTSSPAPANAASVRILCRIIGPLNGASITGFVEWDRAQLEIGNVMTGWRDSNQVLAGNVVTTATALATLTTSVTEQGTTLTSQGTSITGLNNSLTTTNTNVTAAQNAANAANTLAGGKGKVIVQTGAPAAADQLAQNLWIDITGGANTPKRWTGSAWAAVTDKVATDAAAAAANALSVANTKADASAVSSLDSRVTAAEGTISSQGASLTSLNNSLTTTNTNVTAAQNAANAANTLAGGKGKVIVQTGAPVAADQLAQNLWIDITGGANTPKRWTGSAWAAVTDKVATDAAAAAVNALSVANTKADATAVTALTGRVTAAEGAITSQGTSLTSLTNTLSRVGQNSPTKVYQSLFTGLATDQWRLNSASLATVAFSNVAGNLSGATLTFDCGTGKHWWGATNKLIRFDPARLYKVTARVQQVSTVVGNTQTFLGLDGYAEDGVTRINTLGTSSTSNAHYVLTSSRVLEVGVWTEFTAYVKGFTVGAENGGSGAGTLADPRRMKTGIAWISPMGIFGYNNLGGVVALDYFWIEDVTEQVQIDATSTALSGLTSTVSQQGTTLTSQGNSLTQLTNRVGDVEGVNSGQAAALNSLDTRVTSTEGKVTAQATAFQALQASSRDDNGEGELADAFKGWTSTAAIASESKVRTSESEAFAQRITGFDAQIGENTANITELEQVVATSNSATATKIDQLNVSVASNTAAIQQTSTVFADTNGKLSSMWSVKMQINAQGQYVAAGIGLGIENTGAGLQSQFLVSADRFAIVNGINGNLSVPFAVQNGQAFLQSAFILDGTITNAKIGSYISSNNYIPGQQGWVLYKDGTLEINGIVPGQGRLVINSQNVSVYDANNVLRVRLGYLG
jgi:uncharacterized coiled-coil protein SlyX